MESSNPIFLGSAMNPQQDLSESATCILFHKMKSTNLTQKKKNPRNTHFNRINMIYLLASLSKDKYIRLFLFFKKSSII